jgi:outer membrane cobalamin receptor/ABC-type Fe3+-hydroxamate transport system substrate-binding protein
VRGIVVDPEGKPVAGARVECAGRTAMSDVSGRFAVEATAGCRAVVRAAQFETAIVEMSPAAEARVELTIAALSERVVVTATRQAATVEEAGLAASVVTAGEIQQRQFPPVADLLRELPGVQVTAAGRQGAQTSLFLRGASRTGTMVLVDGVPMNDPGGEFNFGNLVSGDVERIETVRGPESALFGAEASAGVVQLFTRRGEATHRRPRGNLSYERGSFHTDSWRTGLLGGSGGRLDYSLYTGQFRTGGEFPNDAFRNTTGSVNAGLRLGAAAQLRGVARISDSAVGVPGQVAYGLIDRDASETNRDAAVGVRLDDARGARFLQQATFAYHRVRDVYRDFQMDGPYRLAALVRDANAPQPRTYLERLLSPEEAAGFTPAAGFRVVTAEATLYPSLEPYVNATHRARFGYQGAWTRAATTAVFGYEHERQGGTVSAAGVNRSNHGAYVHATTALADRYFLAGGLRVERSSVFGAKGAPRGSLGVKLAGARGPVSSSFLRVSAGRGITEPSLIQNFSREFYFTGNPDLRPERTTAYEIALVQEWFGRRARTEVAAFHNSFRDLIAFVSMPAPVWGSWKNLEASRARGVEVSGKARITGVVSFTAAYTRLWTRILESASPSSPYYAVGQELARRPAHSGSLGLSLSPRRWWLQAGALLVGERQDVDYYLGVTRNRGYQSVYLAGSYRLNQHLSPFLRVDNALNSRYQEALGYSSASRSARRTEAGVVTRRLAILVLAAGALGAAPQRIVSTAPSITEMLYALGLGDRVVGVTTFCRYPPEAARKPKIGTYLQPDAESVMAQRPDLVVTEKTMARGTAALKRLGLKVLEVDDGNLGGIYESVRAIARAASVEPRGEALCARIRAELDAIRSAGAGGPRPRVMFVVGRTPSRVEDLIVAGASSYIDELIAVAGAENAFHDAAAPYSKIGLEAVLRRDPDVIIDMGEMARTAGVTERQKQAVVALWSRFPQLKAVRERRVFAVASDVFVVPGPRVVEAARQIAELAGRGARP